MVTISLSTYMLTEENQEPYLPFMTAYAQDRLQDPDVFTLGVANSTYALGAAVCAYHNGEISILSLAIEEEFRNRGIGSYLLRSLLYLCSTYGFTQLSLRYFLPEQEALLLDSFLERNGFFIALGEWQRAQMKLADLAGSPLMRQVARQEAAGPLRTVVPMNRLSTIQLQEALSQMELDREDLLNVSLQLSYVSLKNGRVESATLMSQKEDVVEVSYLYSADPRSGMTAFMAAAGNVIDHYPPETTITFMQTPEMITKLVSKLLGEGAMQSTKMHEATCVVPPLQLAEEPEEFPDMLSELSLEELFPMLEEISDQELDAFLDSLVYKEA